MVTSFYFGLLSLLFVFLSIRALIARRRNRIPYGYGEHNEIAGLVSAHLNFAAYVPISLFGIFLLEVVHGVPHFIVHLFGIFLLLGRSVHAYALIAMESKKRPNFEIRKIGMHLTLWPLIAMGFTNVGLSIRSLYLP